MHSIPRLVHRLVMQAGVEELFVELRRLSGFIRNLLPVKIRHRFTSFGRFIPPSTAYPKDDVYFLTRNNTRFRINRSDYVQWRLFYGVRDNALRIAKGFMQDDSIVLDIGSNSGAFSLKLAAYIRTRKLENITIHAFEPNPAVCENYRYNLGLNPSLKEIVHFYPIGLGSKKQERLFRFDGSNSGAGRIVDNRSGQFAVEIKTLDDVMAMINPRRITFMKLIVEGFEPEVLKGGWQTISQYKPPIFLEVTKSWWLENNANIEDVISSLRSLGYEFLVENNNEMEPYEPRKFDSRYQFNLLAYVSEIGPD